MDIKEKIELESLEKVVKDYDYFLIDNCAFQEVIYNTYFPKSLNGKFKRSQLRKKSIEFWKKNLGFYKNFYTTSKVIEEMRGVRHYDYKGSINKYLLKKNHHRILQLQRSIRDTNKEKNRLIMLLEENRVLVLNLEEQGIYPYFYNLSHNLKNYYKLSETDFDLLISGRVLSKTRGPSAIISNDFGIVKAWKSLLNKKEFSIESLGFFVRQKLTSFRRLS